MVWSSFYRNTHGASRTTSWSTLLQILEAAPGSATSSEVNVDLVTVVVSLVPAGFQRRIDENAPANCPNLPNG